MQQRFKDLPKLERDSTQDPPVERLLLYQCATTSNFPFQEELSKFKWKAERKKKNIKRMKMKKIDERALRAEVYPILPKVPKTTRASLTVPLSVSTFQKSVSDRSVAVFATSVQHDLELVSPIDRSRVIDRNKIRRE